MNDLKPGDPDAPIVVKFKDEEYRTVTTGNLDGDYLDALYNHPEPNWPLAVATMLGPEQWAKFKLTRPKVSDYPDIIRAYTKAQGSDLGEASASSD